MSPRLFYVWCPEYDQTADNATLIRASHAQYAAEDWVGTYERSHCEYPVAGGDEIEVHVKDPEGVTTKWSVVGEAVPHYFVSQISQ